jgi:predicted PurR-regulated permease PerM
MSNLPSSGIGAKFLLVSAAIVIILAGLKAAQSLLSHLLLAVCFALILTPPLRWLKKKGLPDGIAIIVLSTFVFLLGLGVVLIFSNSLTRFASKLPDYKEKVTAGYVTIDGWINNVAGKISAFGESIQQLNPIEFGETESESSPHPFPEGEGEGTNNSLPLDEAGGSFREKLSLSDIIPVNTLISSVGDGIKSLLNIVTVSSLVLIMVMFMLLEAARLPNKVKEAFGGRDLSNEYFRKIADDTWNYMKIKTIICFLTGVATTIGLWFLGVEYAILWGLLMFFLNYLPNIGQIIASVPPILLALIDGGLSLAIWVTLWLVFVNTAFGVGFNQPMDPCGEVE